MTAIGNVDIRALSEMITQACILLHWLVKHCNGTVRHEGPRVLHWFGSFVSIVDAVVPSSSQNCAECAIIHHTSAFMIDEQRFTCLGSIIVYMRERGY